MPAPAAAAGGSGQAGAEEGICAADALEGLAGPGPLRLRPLVGVPPLRRATPGARHTRPARGLVSLRNASTDGGGVGAAPPTPVLFDRCLTAV